MSKLFEKFIQGIDNQINNKPLIDLNQMFYEKSDFDKLEVEEFEVVKGDVTTTITVQFNKKGYAVSTTTKSVTKVNTEEQMENLRKQLVEKINKDDWSGVADLARQMRVLQEQK